MPDVSVFDSRSVISDLPTFEDVEVNVVLDFLNLIFICLLF